jgi:hypothetical protein
MSKPAREVEFEVLGQEQRANDDPFIAAVSRLMDEMFVIPGTNIRFGLDPILGLLPAFGATASSAISLILIALSARRGVPKIVLARMALNVLVNAGFDAVPVVGDALSIFFRSNTRNYELLRKHAGSVRASTTGDWIFLIALLLGVVVVIGLMIAGTIAILRLLLTPTN